MTDHAIDYYLGTMGFGYDDWNDVFYPKSLKSSDRLAFYAKHFNAVELDTTFYAMPPVNRVLKWRDETPTDFRFAVKTPNGITHESTLDRAIPQMRMFLDVMRHLDEKLAVVLLQFPPSFGASELPRLRTFLSAMPRGAGAPRFAVEFRNVTWFDTRGRETFELLREQGVALANADYVAWPRPVVATADFLYVRWIGEHHRFQELDHEQLDLTDRLLWWKEQFALVGAKVKTVFGFFNNDYTGYAIGTSNRFKELVGAPVRKVEDPRQGELFA